MAKNLKNSHFWPIEKIRSKNSKFYFRNFLHNIVVHIQTKYKKDQIKTEEAFSIWKKVDRRTDRRRTAPHQISSADYVSSRAK